MTQDAAQERIVDFTSVAPDRKKLLQMSADDPKRRETIIKRANWIDGDLTNNPTFRHTKQLGDLKDYDPSVRHYDVFDEDGLHEHFLQIKEQWDRSQDARDLRSTFERLMYEDKLPKIDKIVCFGLGELVWAEMLNDREDYARYHTTRQCCQHAAALTLADVLKAQLDGGEEVRLYAQDPEYRHEDVGVLRRVGIEVLNPEYGFHEGFVKVDKNTLVMAIDVGNKLPQVVCETNRPAAMIWADPWTDSPDQWWQLKPTRAILAAEYYKCKCATLEHEWEPWYEAEEVPREVTSYFGKAIPRDRWKDLSQVERNIYESRRTKLGHPVLRRARFIYESVLYVRSAHFKRRPSVMSMGADDLKKFVQAGLTILARTTVVE